MTWGSGMSLEKVRVVWEMSPDLTTMSLGAGLHLEKGRGNRDQRGLRSPRKGTVPEGTKISDH